LRAIKPKGLSRYSEVST